MNDHKATDVVCPSCSADIGVRCTLRARSCQERVNLAAKLTREANQKLRKPKNEK
jgi:hypothetical protein